MVGFVVCSLSSCLMFVVTFAVLSLVGLSMLSCLKFSASKVAAFFPV